MNIIEQVKQRIKELEDKRARLGETNRALEQAIIDNKVLLAKLTAKK